MAHTIDVRYSNDGGNNYSNWRELAAGDTGDFITPLITRRLGHCRHRVWEIRDTSDVAAEILGMSIDMESE